MTPQTSLAIPPPAHSASDAGWRSQPWRPIAAAALAAIGAGLAWQGGIAALAGLALAAGAMVWAVAGRQTGRRATDRTVPTDEPRVSGGRVGTEVMVSQVVPVWSKQLDVASAAAADGLGQLLTTFSAMADTLGSLSDKLDGSQSTLDAGAIEQALADGSPGQQALAALLSPSRRAFEQRDAAMTELTRCAEALEGLRRLGRQAREIGKHTRLVALNATIEANRGGGSQDGGSLAVARETRMLADHIGRVGSQIEALVGGLERTLSPQRLRGEIGETPPEELQMELALRAREALNTLLAALGGAMHNSADVRAASSSLRAQIDETFVQFQFGDRISQMLAIVGSDMQNFARWVGANPYATQSDAAEWLANLETCYTMDEQRSQHHGNVHIDRGSEVEFF